MVETYFLLSVIVFFVLAFAIRNIRTYMSTKQSIKGQSAKLTLSIVISTCIYLLLILRLLFPIPGLFLEFDVAYASYLKYAGFILILIGFIVGVLALVAMKNSWRVGIKHNQKTDLVTSGVYRISRNPYFFSYDVLVLGFLLVFPSVVLGVLYLLLVIIFHLMILEEEQYLERVHGKGYSDYKQRVGRYITFLKKGI
ncbi:MAG: isoprenylcysteine carboxylmethyltransferase family protein [Bacteroidales bacterium]|nr:isoprenylcysteine carboxylmethyltransferase family protein [Bacteroidales bacterium]MBN2751056.1 isoprenylcysteine carboxylmethyltransferase family protein [Bacteroidales bacterium]